MPPVELRVGDRPIVIVGAGLAGGNAAVTLREEGFKGRVALIGREPGVPFGRPPLSKTYLRSEEDLDGWYVRPQVWYDEHAVERLESSAVAMDMAAHVVMLDSGQELQYQKVLIATGGTQPSPGGSGRAAAGDPPSAYGRRVRRDQARSEPESACGSGGNGVHRLRGGRITDATRGSRDRNIS